MALGYLFGCIPTADFVARSMRRSGAVRAGGSANPGALNAARVLGLRAGAAVAVGDVAKGSLACVAGRAIAGDVGAHSAGVAAVIGHCYPVLTGRSGGKGIATSFGQCLATFPAFAPIDAAVAIGVARATRSRRPALVAVSASSTTWVLAALLWWRRDLPNLWGPRPSPLLALANLSTVAVIASRAIAVLRRREPDELVLGG